MKLDCGICGKTLDANIRARYYPEDDTHICELCFPFEEGERDLPVGESAERPAPKPDLYSVGSTRGK